MYNNPSVPLILFCLSLPITVLIIVIVKSERHWLDKLRKLPRIQQFFAVVAFGLIIAFGGDKGPIVIIPDALMEILTRRSDGTLTDLSGALVPGVQAQAVADYIMASSDLVSAADGIIAQAKLDCVALTNQILTSSYDVAYLSLDLPRGTPEDLNHNILVSFQRVEQRGSDLDALVWFSEMPTTNVNIFVEYSLLENQWSTLSPVTNFWPTTEIVDGVACVRYRYSLPAGIVGTPLKPVYEVAFGGYSDTQYLSVPETGVVVSTNGVDCLPYTGWDDYSEGTNSFQVRYVGGIAVEAVIDGISYKGKVGQI